jgi:hypothetical protein
MAFAGKNPFKIPRQLWTVGGFDKQTLAGALTLTHQDSQMLGLDPGGSNRTITLPAPEDGAWFAIFNLADGAENLLIAQADDATTLATANQNEAAIVYALPDKADAAADGWALLAIVTISPS